MKYVILPVLLFAIAIFPGCSKNQSGEPDIIGSWELRKAQSGIMPSIDYPQGNGQRIVFTPTNYTIYENGNVTSSGVYTIRTVDTTGASYCPYNGAGATGYWIEFDHSSINRKQINRPDANTLILTGGCFALDTGLYREYKKQ